jgi:acyl-CoA reductase-like NAD-dependent aldehyde dehydrogenase
MIMNLQVMMDDGCLAGEGPRAAQLRWARTPVRDRLQFIHVLRHLIAENAESLAAAAAAVRERPLAEKLVSEVLPLADACRWLEHNAARVLARQHHGRRGRPLWLHGVDFEVQRRPFGTVLVIGPGNYPLLLPAVHTLHAIVAGNAVRLKPAPGTRPSALAFALLAFEAGLNPALLEILGDSETAAREAIAGGADKVIFTGSSANGRTVLAQLAKTNTPSVMELSGEDAVIVLEDAELDIVAGALRFGTQLNSGETCIAPRRIIAIESIASDLTQCLNTTPASRALPIEVARDDNHAVELVNSAEFALGASLFTRDLARAGDLAARIHTGFVTINDLVIPTADPRMPFGGVKASGFGTTRGAEGLLEMTFPHVVAVRRGGSYPHFSEPSEGDRLLFTAWLQVAHGRHRLAAIPDLFRALVAKIKTTKTKP